MEASTQALSYTGILPPPVPYTRLDANDAVSFILFTVLGGLD
jgi:hypothetical protein